MEQKYTSKDTCISTINKVYKKWAFKENSNILDYGGGRFDRNKEFMENLGHTLRVYDKYNRDKKHNQNTIQWARENHMDYIVCSNVLNVILENGVIEEVIKDIQSFGSEWVLFSIYEGNRSGIGCETSKGWQRNQKASDYIDIISKYFNVITCRNGVISCRQSNVIKLSV